MSERLETDLESGPDVAHSEGSSRRGEERPVGLLLGWNRVDWGCGRHAWKGLERERRQVGSASVGWTRLCPKVEEREKGPKKKGSHGVRQPERGF